LEICKSIKIVELKGGANTSNSSKATNTTKRKRYQKNTKQAKSTKTMITTNSNNNVQSERDNGNTNTHPISNAHDASEIESQSAVVCDLKSRCQADISLSVDVDGVDVGIVKQEPLTGTCTQKSRTTSRQQRRGQYPRWMKDALTASCVGASGASRRRSGGRKSVTVSFKKASAHSPLGLKVQNPRQTNNESKCEATKGDSKTTTVKQQPRKRRATPSKGRLVELQTKRRRNTVSDSHRNNVVAEGESIAKNVVCIMGPVDSIEEAAKIAEEWKNNSRGPLPRMVYGSILANKHKKPFYVNWYGVYMDLDYQRISIAEQTDKSICEKQSSQSKPNQTTLRICSIHS
jgi:hypothetical protein